MGGSYTLNLSKSGGVIRRNSSGSRKRRRIRRSTWGSISLEKSEGEIVVFKRDLGSWRRYSNSVQWGVNFCEDTTSRGGARTLLITLVCAELKEPGEVKNRGAPLKNTE